MLGVISILYLLIAIAVLAAWLLSIRLLIQAGESKGYSMSNRALIWFIGIFATPIVAGLYIVALPDKSNHRSLPSIESGE